MRSHIGLVVDMHITVSELLLSQLFENWIKAFRDKGPSSGGSDQCHDDAGNFFLPINQKMVRVFADGDVGQNPRTKHPTFDKFFGKNCDDGRNLRFCDPSHTSDES